MSDRDLQRPSKAQAQFVPYRRDDTTMPPTIKAKARPW